MVRQLGTTALQAAISLLVYELNSSGEVSGQLLRNKFILAQIEDLRKKNSLCLDGINIVEEHSADVHEHLSENQ